MNLVRFQASPPVALDRNRLRASWRCLSGRADSSAAIVAERKQKRPQ